MIPAAFTALGEARLSRALQQVLDAGELFLTHDRAASDLAQSVALGTAVRLVQIYKGITMLVPERLGLEIGALARTAAEFTLVVSWIGTDSRRATEFLDLGSFEGAKAVRLLRSRHGVIFDTGELAAHFQNIQEARVRQSVTGSDPSVNYFAMAEGSPKALIPTDFYDLYYRGLSMSAHASSASIVATLTGRVRAGLGGVLYMASEIGVRWLKSLSVALPDAQELGRMADELASELVAILETEARPGALDSL